MLDFNLGIYSGGKKFIIGPLMKNSLVQFDIPRVSELLYVSVIEKTKNTHSVTNVYCQRTVNVQITKGVNLQVPDDKMVTSTSVMESKNHILLIQ